jgi:hypothetical protein
MPSRRRRAAQQGHLKVCSPDDYKRQKQLERELYGEAEPPVISEAGRANALIRIELLQRELADAVGVRKAQLTAQLRAAERRIGVNHA